MGEGITKFWMVIGEKSSATNVRHTEFANAKDEAERLVRKHGGRFIILEAMAFAELNLVQWKECEEPNGSNPAQ